MNDKSNIAIAISLVAFFISLYSLTSTTDNEDIFTKSPNKTYISPDPAAKSKIDNIEKNMRENPFTPTMDGSSKLPKTAIKFATDFTNLEMSTLILRINILLPLKILEANRLKSQMQKDHVDALSLTGQKNQFFLVKVVKLKLYLDHLKVKLVASKPKLLQFLQILPLKIQFLK